MGPMGMCRVAKGNKESSLCNFYIIDRKRFDRCILIDVATTTTINPNSNEQRRNGAQAGFPFSVLNAAPYCDDNWIYSGECVENPRSANLGVLTARETVRAGRLSGTRHDVEVQFPDGRNGKLPDHTLTWILIILIRTSEIQLIVLVVVVER